MTEIHIPAIYVFGMLAAGVFVPYYAACRYVLESLEVGARARGSADLLRAGDSFSNHRWVASDLRIQGKLANLIAGRDNVDFLERAERDYESRF